MNSKIKLALYGVSVFCIYILLTWLLKLIAHKMPEGDAFLGVFTSSDLWIGLAIAVLLTYSHYMKMRQIKK